MANYIEETSVKQIYVLNVIKREKWKQRKKEQDKNRELESKYVEIFRKEQDRKRELELKCTQCIDCDKKILLKYKRCAPWNTIFKEKK